MGCNVKTVGLHLEIMPCQMCSCLDQPRQLMPPGCEKSAATTCCVQLLRLTVMTSSALPYLAGYSLHTANLSTSASALMTRKNCSNKPQLGMEGHPVGVCVMCVMHFD